MEARGRFLFTYQGGLFMLRIALCDDDQAQRELLANFLNHYLSSKDYAVELVEYVCGEPLAADYEGETAGYDLIFLDIFMGGIDGMQTARAIRRRDTGVSIIFLTTTPDYALEGYDVRAMGYLVKPLMLEKTAALLDYFLRAEYSGGQKTLLVREGVRGARIVYREILFVESRNSMLLVHTADGQEHRVYRRLDEVEGELAGRSFLRCHQSYLVNLAYVRAAEKDSFVLESGVKIPLRRQMAKQLRESYFCYLLGQAELTKL